jgi:hypothetical protein
MVCPAGNLQADFDLKHISTLDSLYIAPDFDFYANISFVRESLG